MWLRILPWVGCLVLGGLLLNAHQTIGEEREACNTRVEAGARLAERSARLAEKENFDSQIAELRRQGEAKDREIEILNESAVMLAADSATHAATIERLTLEAEFDEEDLPDSKECLNVFVLRDSIAGVQRASSCPNSGSGDDSGDALSADSGNSHEGQSAFSNITYSDALTIWQRDRSSLIQSNCQLTAIRNLSSGSEASN
jgi:hypothetical protein